MLRITGDCLRSRDKAMLRRAALYTIDYLFRPNQLTGVHIHVHVSEYTGDEEPFKGECSFAVNKRGTKCARIWLNASNLKPQCRTQLYRLEVMLTTLFHELVHARQYITGELKDIDEEHFKWRGKRCREPASDDNDTYYSQAHEIEAYGMEPGLWDRFVRHVNGER